MANKLRIGVFGGARGETMMNVLRNHPDAELVAVCDKYEPLLKRAKAKAEEVGIKVELFNNFEDFIEYPMDAVVLANYATEHATFGIRCLKKGLHVLSEVLPCETMAQAVELIETVEETGLVYAYAENYCYMQHAFEMWRRYKTGELGEVQYGEGEYIHDCSSIWPQITYGDKTHWRNNHFATYYCTHSLGPLLTMTGLRPVKVVGFECPPDPNAIELGMCCGAGIEMVTLENGAIIRSVHGSLKREPTSYNFQLYATKGMMESGRFTDKQFGEGKVLSVYKEGDQRCKGEWERYDPEGPIERATKVASGHHGSDYYPTHYFIEKILGRPEGYEWSIDVYKAVDMGICGLLAFRSVLAGNTSIDVPNLRIKEERDKWRNDHACTNPAIAGDAVMPKTSFPIREVTDEEYAKVRELWLAGKNA